MKERKGKEEAKCSGGKTSRSIYTRLGIQYSFLVALKTYQIFTKLNISPKICVTANV